LAKKLNTNHMTVINRLRELVDENVLDFRMASMPPGNRAGLVTPGVQTTYGKGRG